MTSYINLFGQKCFTKSEEKYTYSVDLLDIFKDCISLDLITNPVIIVSSPITIYDQSNLVEWFSRSDTEPSTGVKMDSKFKTKYILNYIIAMTLLEHDKTNDNLIFHKPNIDLINLVKLVENIYKSKNNNTYSDDGVVYLDLDYYTQFTTKYEYKNNFTEYFEYKLEDILINDMYSGLPLVNPVIVNNLILNKESFIWTSSAYVVGSLQGELKITNEKDSVIDMSIFINKVKTYFNTSEFKEKDLKNVVKKGYCTFLFYSNEDGIKRCFNTSVRTDVRNGDFYLESTKTYEYMYKVYLQYKNELTKPSFQKKLKILNNYFSKNTSMLTSPKYGYSTDMLELRENVNFPILSNEGPYTDDFSFLNMSDMIFVPDNNDVDLKGREFVGTIFSGTEFYNMSFSVCTFVASNLVNATFNNCKFKECVFYKCSMANCKFNNCTLDKKTCDKLTNKTFNFNSHYN